MKSYLFTTSLFCILIISCVNDSDNVIVVDPDSRSRISFDNLYRAKQVIELENSGLAMVGEVSKILFHKDRIFVLSGLKHSRYYYTVFDTTGGFLYRMNKRGRGPGEYIKIGDIFLNGDSLIVGCSDKFLYYDIDGNFITEKLIKAGTFISMEYIKTGDYLVNYGVCAPDSEDGNHYSVKLYSSNGSVLMKSLPIPQTISENPFFAMSSSVFLTKGDFTYFFPMTHNSIYSYSNVKQRFDELYVVNVSGRHTFDIQNVNPELIPGSRWLFEKDVLWVYDIGDNHLLFRINSTNRNESVISFFNRNTGINYIIDKDNFYDGINNFPIRPKDNNLGTLVSLVERENANAIILVYDLVYK